MELNKKILKYINKLIKLRKSPFGKRWHWIFNLHHQIKSLKDPNAGKDWRQEEKGMTEDEMVGWHHWLNGHEFEQALGVCDGQGSLECGSPWGLTELNINSRWVKKLNVKNNTSKILIENIDDLREKCLDTHKNLRKENVNKLDDIKIKNFVKRFFTKAMYYFVDLGIEKEH